MKNFTFVIIDDNQNNALKTKAIAESFQNMHFLAMSDNYEDGLDVVLEYNPDIIFLEIDPQETESKLSLALINELHRYLSVVPKIFVTTSNDALCLEAFKYGVFDYLIHPVESKDLRKSIFRLAKELGVINSIKSTIPVSNVVSVVAKQEVLAEKTPVIIEEENVIDDILLESEESIQEVEEEAENVSDSEEIETSLLQEELTPAEVVPEKTERKSEVVLKTEIIKEKPLIICVKSYGDYRYIDAKDIAYLQADNNSTDIHLNSGEMITAFKTLKHFEGVMTYPFVRIHNSYIVNIDYVSRIHTGNSVCHIKNTTTKLPFSKSYKENIDAIIATIAAGNYLEI